MAIESAVTYIQGRHFLLVEAKLLSSDSLSCFTGCYSGGFSDFVKEALQGNSGLQLEERTEKPPETDYLCMPSWILAIIFILFST